MSSCFANSNMLTYEHGIISEVKNNAVRNGPLQTNKYAKENTNDLAITDSTKPITMHLKYFKANFCPEKIVCGFMQDNGRISI